MQMTEPAQRVLTTLRRRGDRGRDELRQMTGLDDVALTEALLRLDALELVRAGVDHAPEVHGLGGRVVRWGAIA